MATTTKEKPAGKNLSASYNRYKWKMDRAEQGLVDAIGNEIFLHYE